MFTGLVKCLGTVRDATTFGKGRRFRIDVAELAGTVAVGQSIAINGVCLTATSLSGPEVTFDAVAETVARTNLGALRAGSRVNLEPALKTGDALDGHIVQGHVDALARVISVDASSPDNRVLKVALPETIRHLVAEKGSVAVDGISLTVAAAGADWFTIAVIPHTWDNSTLSLREPGDGVNVEVDVLARYIARIIQYGPAAPASGNITSEFLRENGFA